jgi:hypothetical protein
MSVTRAQMIADARAAVAEVAPAKAREGIESGAVGLALDVVACAEAGLPVETSREWGE